MVVEICLGIKGGGEGVGVDVLRCHCGDVWYGFIDNN